MRPDDPLFGLYSDLLAAALNGLTARGEPLEHIGELTVMNADAVVAALTKKAADAVVAALAKAAEEPRWTVTPAADGGRVVIDETEE